MKITSSLLIVCVATVAIACGRSAEEAKRDYFDRGNTYFDTGKFREAIIEYRNAIRQDATFGDARYKLAQAYERNGDRGRALQEYVRAADLLPKKTEIQLKAASYLLLSRQIEDAQTRIQLVLDLEPDNIEAHIMRASALAALNDFDGAITQMEEAIRLDPGRGLTYSNLAALRLAKGQSDEAKAAFEKAVEVAPDSIPSLMALAVYRWSSGDLKGAEQGLRRVVAIDPRHIGANRALAAFYLGTNRPSEAEQPLKNVAEATGSADARFALARYYVAAKKIEAAQGILKPMAVEQATMTKAQAFLAEIERLSGRADRAHAMLDAVLAREPASTDLLLTKARWLLGEGKRDEALSRATAAVKADPKSVDGHYLLGVLHATLGNREAAAGSFREVLRLNPSVAAAQLQLSQIELAQGRTDSAMELAEAVVKGAPNNPVARLNLAQGLVVRQDFARAEPIIVDLLKQHPNVAPVHALDGALRLSKKDLAGARRSYARALELDAGSVGALTGMTTVDVVEKKVPAARARLESRLAAEPNRTELLLLASRFYSGTRDWAAAEGTLRHLIEVAPFEPRGYSLLAQVYLVQRKLDSALKEFDGIVQRNPNDAQARTMGGIIAETKNDRADAKKRYKETVDMAPTAAVAANNLAWLYAEDKENLDVALRLAEGAVRQLPNRAEVHDTLGWVQYRRELPTLAVPAFEQSIAKDPVNPMFHYHLGLAWLKAGEAEKARASLKRALELRPDFPEAAEARKALLSIGG